ncbi:MAG: Sec-independent protein translocase subunit TatA/TatB [Planctomycetota bacterium]
MKLTATHYLLLPILSLALPSCALGGPEIMIIALVVLLLFGGAKLPGLMRGMGSGVHEFKKGLKDGEGDDDTPADKDKDKE